MNDDSEHSQSDTITYDDPAGRMEREKIMAQLKRGNSPSPDFYTEDEEEDRRDNKTDTVGVIGIKHARLWYLKGQIIKVTGWFSLAKAET